MKFIKYTFCAMLLIQKFNSTAVMSVTKSIMQYSVKLLYAGPCQYFFRDPKEEIPLPRSQNASYYVVTFTVVRIENNAGQIIHT